MKNLRAFTVHAQEALRFLSTKIEQPGHTQAMLSVFQRLLSEAVHWSLSPDALDLVWNTFPSNEVFKGTSLPYPIMVVEFRFDYERLGLPVPTNADPCRNRFCLLVTRKALLELTMSPGKEDEETALLQRLMDDEDMDRDFFLLPFWEYEVEDPRTLMPGYPNGWICGQNFVRIGGTALDNIEHWLNDTGIIFGSYPNEPVLVPIEIGKKETTREDGIAVMDEMRIAMAFLAILSSPKAPIEVLPSPDKLNKKRAAKGKPLIPPYRTLNITHPQHVRAVIERAHSEGWKVSPHWRRGHVRNQPYKTTGEYKRIWIKPTLVGVGAAKPRDVRVV
jgi:hypothetical protein